MWNGRRGANCNGFWLHGFTSNKLMKKLACHKSWHKDSLFGAIWWHIGLAFQIFYRLQQVFFLLKWTPLRFIDQVSCFNTGTHQREACAKIVINILKQKLCEISNCWQMVRGWVIWFERRVRVFPDCWKFWPSPDAFLHFFNNCQKLWRKFSDCQKFCPNAFIHRKMAPAMLVHTDLNLFDQNNQFVIILLSIIKPMPSILACTVMLAQGSNKQQANVGIPREK